MSYYLLATRFFLIMIFDLAIDELSNMNSSGRVEETNRYWARVLNYWA
jgi:hypothetical protein